MPTFIFDVKLACVISVDQASARQAENEIPKIIEDLALALNASRRPNNLQEISIEIDDCDGPVLVE